jgi:hypothetical protein
MNSRARRGKNFVYPIDKAYATMQKNAGRRGSGARRVGEEEA